MRQAFRCLFFFLTAVIVQSCTWCCAQVTEELKEERQSGWSIVIHGGAGSSPDTFTRIENESRYQGIETALRLGVKRLQQGDTAIETVEIVIRHLEDNPLFNAGKGAVFNAEGKHELDASIMDGRDLSCGAVAGVTVVKHPITLAQRVMTDTSHVLFAGQGADAFARRAKVELVENDYFDTPGQRQKWQESTQAASQSSNGQLLDSPVIGHKGTVGCVVLDPRGNLAAGTSTGGLTGKKFGRVGDSPIVGAGTYADNATCGISCTGHGEHFIRHAVAYDVSARMRYVPQSLKEATRVILHEVLQPGWGGLIGIDRRGEIVMDFNTDGMACGAANSSGMFEVQWDVDQSRIESAP